MAHTDLRDFYRRYIAVLNAREFDALDGIIHDEVTFNGTPVTRDDIVAVLQQEIDAVPDMHWELTDLIVDGDRLGAQLVNTGTPVETFLGVAPTGAAFEVTEYAVYEVRDGRFLHMAALHDAEGVRKQLTA
jgi:predicted ester cyclase